MKYFYIVIIAKLKNSFEWFHYWLMYYMHKNLAHISLLHHALKNLTYLLMVIRVKRNRTFIFYVFSCRLSLFLLQVLCDRWPGENKHSRINEKYAHCNVINWIVGLHWGRNVPINTSCCNFSNWWQIICMYKDSTY